MNIIALLAGILFGSGLTISQLINPDKIINFLDIMGHWDPSVLVVMASALSVTWVGYSFVLKKSKPLCGEEFNLPTKKSLDFPLMFGAAIFGIGWGLAGYCPGPGITAIGLFIADAIYFVCGMVLSAIAIKLVSRLHI
jgi:uncharacterized membrane protein YedE/YeeE